MRKNVLVIGKNGQLAQGFRRSFALKNSNSILFAKSGQRQIQYDLTFWGREETPLNTDDNRYESWQAKIEAISPSLIINTAAFTAVDRAESDKEQNSLKYLNEEIPQILAQYSTVKKIPLFHFSTDYVYSGIGQNFWSETDLVEPKNKYGFSKLQGEKKILQTNADAFVFRTSWVYSPVGSNFVKTILRLASEREELKIVSDQIGSPTSAFEMAQIITHEIENLMDLSTNLKGTYNLAGHGITSWYEFTKEIIGQAKKLGWPVKTESILPITTEEYPTPAIRPKNSRLNQEKAQTCLNLRMQSWKDGLREVLAEIIALNLATNKKDSLS